MKIENQKSYGQNAQFSGGQNVTSSQAELPFLAGGLYVGTSAYTNFLQVYVSANGELSVNLATSATSTAAGTYNVYVDYIFV